MKKGLFSKKNFLKNTRGAISIFLALLMVPFTSIAGALIGAGRVNSASAIFDQAMSNAADSTLAGWDSFLKDRFGLLAVTQADSLENTNAELTNNFSKYMTYNTMALNNTFFDVSTNCTGMYPLADTNVLLYQVLESAKYSVPTKLAMDGLDIDGIIKSLEEMIPGSNWLSFISSGASVGSSIVDLGNASNAYADAADELNTAKGYYDTSYSALESTLSTISSTITSMNNELSSFDSKISSKEKEYSEKQKDVSNSNSQASTITDKITKFEDLKESISDLLDDKKKTPDNTLQETIKNLKNEGLLDKSINEKTVDLEDLLDTVEDKIKELEKSEKSASSSSSSAQKAANKAKKELEKLKSDRAAKKTEYENKLKTLYSQANTNKSEYSSDIQELINKLETAKSKKISYDAAVEEVRSSLQSAASAGVDALSSQDKKNLENQKNLCDEQIKKAKDDLQSNAIDQEQYNSISKQWQDKKQSLQDQIDSNSNSKTIYDAGSSALNTMMDGFKGNLAEFTDEYYDLLINNLKSLKTSVDSINVKSYGNSFNASTFKNKYYISNIKLVTRAIIEAAEKDLVAELTSDSIWSVIKGFIDFITTLIQMLLPYNPNLNTNLDQTYYGNFDWDNIAKGNAEDKKLSETYKQLFGSFSATDITSDGNFSFADAIFAVFNDVNTIKSNLNFEEIAKSLVGFGNAFSEIENALNDIKTQFSNIISWAKNIVSVAYEKSLLVGYLSYNTSCRTTYLSGSALTGASFNLRGQTSNLEESIDEIDGIGSFLAIFKSAITGETGKCFVGAETEYLINGKNSEISNQLWTFLQIYALRLICNVVQVVTNAEVGSIAAATTIGAPIVYALYILLEPLVDCAILTNGGSVPLIKSGLYLVPSGFGTLISKITSITLTSAQLKKTKSKFESSVNDIAKKIDPKSTPNYKVSTENSKVESEFEVDVKKGKFNYTRSFDFEYKDYLMIYMIFVSSDKLISRFRDIVQMEAVQNLYVKNFQETGNKTWEGVNFDLARSYTYLRLEGQFSTNEFMSISGSNIKMKDRLLYRGY